MRYRTTEIIDMMDRHCRKMRDTLAEPSAEVQAMWLIQDQGRELLRQYYARKEKEEDEENFTINFTSEVKLK